MNRDSESGGAPADQHVLCRQEIARLKVEYDRVLVLENDAAADRDRGKAEIASFRKEVGRAWGIVDKQAAELLALTRDIARLVTAELRTGKHVGDDLEPGCEVCIAISAARREATDGR